MGTAEGEAVVGDRGVDVDAFVGTFVDESVRPAGRR